MPPIHVCVHSLRDNGCSPGDIEIASVKLSLHARGREKGRKGRWLAGLSINQSVCIQLRAERRQPPARTSLKFTVGGRSGRLYQHFCLHCEIFTSAVPVSPARKAYPSAKRHK